MDIYLELYNSDPAGFEEDLKSSKYNVSPLSNLIADEIPNLTHHQILVSYFSILFVFLLTLLSFYRLISKYCNRMICIKLIKCFYKT